MLDPAISRIFANQWLVFGIVTLLLLIAAEFGFRFGLRLYEKHDEPRKTQIAGTQTAILGLLGLLLAFTFAMAAARYESRRQLVLEEAKAIGTTYHQASLLPEEHKTNVENLLRRYVNVRLDFYYAGKSKAAQNAAQQAAAKLQQELWNHAVAAAKEAPTPITATFIKSLSDTIDLDAMRLHGLRTRVPGAVWILLLVVAISGCWVSGYGAGGSGERGAFIGFWLPLLIGVVITLIADLDRPRGGLIGTSQEPLLDLQLSLHQTMNPDRP